MNSNLWKFARRFFPIAGISAAALLAGCATLSSVSPWQVARVGSPQMITQSPKAYGWGFLSHPYLTRLPNGVIHCGYNLAGDVAGPSKARPELLQFSPAVSTNEGRSWIVGTNAAPLAQQTIFSHSVTVGDKRVSLHNTHNPLATNIALSSKVLMPDGTVTGPFNSVVGPVKLHDWGALSESGVARTNELLMVGYGKFKDVLLYGKKHLFKTCLFRSVDEGRKWEFLNFVAEPKDISWGDQFGFEGPCEPALIEVANGELLCVMRTGGVNKNMFETTPKCTDMAIARSADSGRTWKVERLSGHSGVMPRFTRMPNGALVLVYGRPGNMLTVSYDEGHSWSAPVSISPSGVKTSGYIGLLPVGPNRLLCTYDVYNTDLSGIWLWEPKEVNGVFSVFVEIAPGPNAKGMN